MRAFLTVVTLLPLALAMDCTPKTCQPDEILCSNQPEPNPYYCDGTTACPDEFCIPAKGNWRTFPEFSLTQPVSPKQEWLHRRERNAWTNVNRLVLVTRSIARADMILADAQCRVLAWTYQLAEISAVHRRDSTTWDVQLNRSATTTKCFAPDHQKSPWAMIVCLWALAFQTVSLFELTADQKFENRSFKPDQWTNTTCLVPTTALSSAVTKKCLVRTPISTTTDAPCHRSAFPKRVELALNRNTTPEDALSITTLWIAPMRNKFVPRVLTWTVAIWGTSV